MVLPLVAPIVGGAWLGQAIFGGDDMSQVQKMLPIYLAVQDGSPRPLHDAAMIASDHGRKQAGFADNADKLSSLLKTAWEGDASEAATKQVTKLSKSARETGTALDTNGKNFESQALSFNDLQGQMKPMDNPAPEGSGFLDRVAPWDTGAEEAVERNQEAAKHNTSLYEGYGNTTKSNAEGITDKYGNAGNAGQPVDPGTREPGDPNDPSKSQEEARRQAEEQRKKAEAEAAKRQAEAQKRAEEQRKKMEEEARKRQEEAQKRAEEQRKKMEQEAKQRQEEAQRRAEEQRKKMEQEARQRQEEAQRRAEEQRRRMQQEAEERARQAREQMKLGGSKFNPSGTSASSFSPSDFAGAGAGAGSGAGGVGASGAAGMGAGADGAAGAGKASGAMAPGAGAAGAGAGAGGARGGAGGMRGGGMGGMMGGGAGGGGKGGEDKEHKRKVMATENPNDLFGTDEKAVPPVIGEK